MVGMVRAISYAKQQATEELLHANHLIGFDEVLVALLRRGPAPSDALSCHRSIGYGGSELVAVHADATRAVLLRAACALALLVAIVWVANTARGGTAPYRVLFRERSTSTSSDSSG